MCTFVFLMSYTDEKHLRELLRYKKVCVYVCVCVLVCLVPPKQPLCVSGLRVPKGQ